MASYPTLSRSQVRKLARLMRERAPHIQPSLPDLGYVGPVLPDAVSAEFAAPTKRTPYKVAHDGRGYYFIYR